MKVLFFGAHPDDIEISASGTVLRHVDAGHCVTGYVFTIPQDKKIRSEELKQSEKELGVSMINLDIQNSMISFDRNLIGLIDGIIKKEKPHIVYTHWIHDSHQDHQSISKATIASSRENSFSLLMYDQTFPGGITEEAFNPQVFNDITPYMDTKIKSIMAHKSQIAKNNPNMISAIKGRCSYYGFQFGVEYAEVFEVVKLINNITPFK